MTLQEKLSNVKKSGIFKLVFEDEILGLRTVYFNVNSDTFEYYDFSVDLVTDERLRTFINSLEMPSVRLYLNSEDSLVSEDEEREGIFIKELTTEEDVNRVLSVFPKIYEYKKKGVS